MRASFIHIADTHLGYEQYGVRERFNDFSRAFWDIMAEAVHRRVDFVVMAGDLLFPRGGYELSAAGQAALSEYVPQLRSVQNVKIVVYGFTDNAPVGPALQRAGIADNLDLSSRRAAAVVAFLRSKGVNPNILSVKGFRATHPIAPNDTPQGRAQNRRIEIVLEGTGA